MEDVILNHLDIASREKFLSISDSSPPFILKERKLLFDEGNYYSQVNNTGAILINGEQEGFVIAWWGHARTKRYEMYFEDGKPDGIQIGWNTSGKRVSEIHWKNGKQDGPETRWDKSGKETYVQIWKNGEKAM
jgi:antitoxin component YwqK of YwqJK toxin-antitoxin module